MQSESSYTETQFPELAIFLFGSSNFYLNYGNIFMCDKLVSLLKSKFRLYLIEISCHYKYIIRTQQNNSNYRYCSIKSFLKDKHNSQQNGKQTFREQIVDREKKTP